MPQQTYQQPVFVSCQPGQGAVAVAGMQPCYSLLPPNQHTTMRYELSESRVNRNSFIMWLQVVEGVFSCLALTIFP